MPGPNARRLLWAGLLLLTCVKAYLAWRLPLLGDEAFYWLESRAPAAGYSDVPGLTPWLVALGTAAAGDTPLGVRLPFLLLGAALPALVLAWARRSVDESDACAAAALSMLLPLAAVLGVLATPDVPLTVAFLLVALTLDEATRTGRRRDHALLAAALALGWLSHYRFVMAYVAGLAFLLGTERGRAAWRSPRFWGAQALGALGLAPALWFNATHGWAALQFQFVERHAWGFKAGELRAPLVQAGATTPLLFAALLAALAVAWRGRARRDAPLDVAGSCAGGLLLGYLVLGLFADDARVRFHWPLPAYLLLLPLVPGVLRSWRASAGRLARAAGALTAPLALAGAVCAFGVLALATLPAPVGPSPLDAARLDNLQGWREVSGWALDLARLHPDHALVADNFMLAAELAFALDDARPVYSLDHPLNARHGRALQLAVLGRDQAALAAAQWRAGLLFVEESARRLELDRPPAYHALRRTFGSVRRLGELSLFDGRWHFEALEVTPALPGADAAPGPGPGPYDLPPFAYVDAPVPGARVPPGPLEVRGWAFQDGLGLARVEVLLDGALAAEARYGLPAARVRATWPESDDPRHPDVGFMATLDLARTPPGRHRLALRLVDRAGRASLRARQDLVVEVPPGR